MDLAQQLVTEGTKDGVATVNYSALREGLNKLYPGIVFNPNKLAGMLKRARDDAARKLVALEGHVGRVGKAIHIARGGGGSRPERRSKLQPVRALGAAEARCVRGLLLDFRISGHALLEAVLPMRHRRRREGRPTRRCELNGDKV